jgi:hypothetical protein
VTGRWPRTFSYSLPWFLLVTFMAVLPASAGVLLDPVWIVGIYDGADFDDVIGSIDIGDLDVPPGLLAPVGRPAWLSIEEAVGNPLTDRSTSQPRAPPAP